MLTQDSRQRAVQPLTPRPIFASPECVRPLCALDHQLQCANESASYADGHCLRAVARPELLEDGLDVCLDGALADVERPGDLEVRSSVGQTLQHFELPRGQHVTGHMFRELGRNGRIDGLAPGVYGLHGFHELRGGDILEQIAGCSGPQPAEHLFVGIVCGEQDDLGARVLRTNRGSELGAVHGQHAQITDHDVGQQLAIHGQSGGAIAGLTRHLEAFDTGKERRQPLAQDGVIVDEQQANGRGRRHDATPGSGMPKDRVETAQLQREIVGVAVHDLGSVAAALAMRAALPSDSVQANPAIHQAALASLAGQVRAAMHLLDVARVSPDAPLRSPAGPWAVGPSVSLDVWLQRWPALGQVVLPRGARLRVDGADTLADQTYALPLQTDAVATPVLLCGLHALHNARDVTLQVEIPEGGDVAPVLICTMRSASRGRSPSRWQRYAEHVLSTVDWSLHWWEADARSGHVLRLTVPLARARLQESA